MSEDQNDITLDQAMAELRDAQGGTPAMRRVFMVIGSQRELFDAASVILDWMRALPPEDRPITKFNRLLDAVNGVREAHQLGV